MAKADKQGLRPLLSIAAIRYGFGNRGLEAQLHSHVAATST